MYCNIFSGFTNEDRDECEPNSIIEVQENNNVVINMTKIGLREMVAIDIKVCKCNTKFI